MNLILVQVNKFSNEIMYTGYFLLQTCDPASLLKKHPVENYSMINSFRNVKIKNINAFTAKYLHLPRFSMNSWLNIALQFST